MPRRFNPRPRFRGTKGKHLYKRSITFYVSIHAPVSGGRKVAADQVSALLPVFQSTPPFPGDESGSATRSWAARRSFNPRPRFRGTKGVAGWDLTFSAPFQSTPPFPGDESDATASKCTHTLGFNPRPRFRGTKAFMRCCVPPAIPVSIHAPVSGGRKYACSHLFRQA